MSQGSESENDFESADEGDGIEPGEKTLTNDVLLGETPSTDSKVKHKTIENEGTSSLCVVAERTSTSFSEETPPEAVSEVSTTDLSVTSSLETVKKSEISNEDEKTEIISKNVVKQDIQNIPQKTERVLLLKERKELERATKSAITSKDEKLSVQPTEEKNSPGWGLVGGWSSSFLSSMASSASTFTSHVTQGIGTVLETVEATLGAPSPEELAGLAKKPEKEEEQVVAAPVEDPEPETPNSSEAGHSVGGLFGGVSAITRALENTGSKVITGGLDTLELIGKKTMDILTEGDPGLRKKRTLFGVGEDTTLSQVLRDAKTKYEEVNQSADDGLDDSPAVCYSKIFDDFQGLVHLEALEILSGHSKMRLKEQLLVMGPDEPCHAELQDLRAACMDLPPNDDTPDDEATQDFERLVDEHMSVLPIKINIDKIKSVQGETRSWVSLCKSEQDTGKVRDAKEIYERAITSLAELTARSMELFHKMSELLLMTGRDLADLHSFAQHFTGLTAVLCTEVGILTSQFCQCLSTAADDSEDPDAINPLITNVYLEASNSNTYIQDAFQLLIPIFQELAVRK